jgi:hypothetical protein
VESVFEHSLHEYLQTVKHMGEPLNPYAQVLHNYGSASSHSKGLQAGEQRFSLLDS